jgi:hypothetical protein
LWNNKSSHGFPNTGDNSLKYSKKSLFPIVNPPGLVAVKIGELFFELICRALVTGPKQAIDKAQ